MSIAYSVMLYSCTRFDADAYQSKDSDKMAFGTDLHRQSALPILAS